MTYSPAKRQAMEICPNLHPRKIWVNLRTQRPSTLIFVRTLTQFTTTRRECSLAVTRTGKTSCFQSRRRFRRNRYKGKRRTPMQSKEAQGNKDATRPRPQQRSFWEVLLVFTRLGLTSFGGPIAHLGYFREEIVVRRKWVAEEEYADLLALCQFLPGPSSSQMGIALGITRAGLWGGLAAWLGFTLPSALALTLFAYVAASVKNIAQSGWLHGLLIVAVAVVAQAVWGMATSLCPDRPRATIAISAAITILLWPTAIGQILIMVLAGLFGWRFLRGTLTKSTSQLPLFLPRRLAVACWVIF